MLNRLLYQLWKNKKEVNEKLVKRGMYFTNNNENRRQGKKDLRKNPHCYFKFSNPEFCNRIYK